MSEEYMIVVNRNDRILRYHLRGTQPYRQFIFRICVVFIENAHGEVLIQKRSMNKDFGPGLWEAAAGGVVSKGESYRLSSYRELEEEIGVTPNDITLQYVTKNLLEDGMLHPRMVGWFSGVIDWPIERFVLQPNEVTEIKWVKKSDLYEDVARTPDLYMPSAKYWPMLFP